MEDLLFYSQSRDLRVCNIFKPKKMNSIQNVTVNYPTLTLVIKKKYIYIDRDGKTIQPLLILGKSGIYQHFKRMVVRIK